MQDANHGDAEVGYPIVDEVATRVAAAVATPDFIARYAKLRVCGELLEARVQKIDVRVCLLRAPLLPGIQPDFL